VLDQRAGETVFHAKQDADLLHRFESSIKNERRLKPQSYAAATMLASSVRQPVVGPYAARCGKGFTVPDCRSDSAM
jgi:hypothetical protein